MFTVHFKIFSFMLSYFEVTGSLSDYPDASSLNSIDKISKSNFMRIIFSNDDRLVLSFMPVMAKISLTFF